MSVQEWSPLLISVVAISIFLWGASKMAMPALSMVSAAALAAALSPTVASGFAIPLLLIGDVIALARFRQHAQWRLILRLIPGMLVGFVIVALIFEFVPDFAVARLVGVLIMISLILEANRQRLLIVASRGGSEVSDEPQGATARRLTAGFFGVLAGMTTMAANAGGAALTVYLVKLRVPMLAFMGTSTWFFLILNLMKVPFLVGLDLITWESLRANLWFVPALILGTAAGALAFRELNQRWFTTIALSLSFLAACWLLIRG